MDCAVIISVSRERHAKRHSPDDPPVGSQHALCERCAVVRTERTRRVDLVPQAREEDLAFALERDFFPIALVSVSSQS